MHLYERDKPSGQLGVKDMDAHYEGSSLLRTEIATLIGLMARSKIITDIPAPATVQGYVDRTDALMKELHLGVDKTWGSCGAFSVCDGQPTIENCGPCDGYSVSPFGRPPHPSALSHAGIGNVID